MTSRKVALYLADLAIEVALILLLNFLISHFFTALGSDAIMVTSIIFGILLYRRILLPYILRVTHL